MSYKYWAQFASLALLGAAQSVACSSKFNSCQERRTCAPGGASGRGGAAGARTGDGEAGAEEGGEGGTAGLDTRAGAAGTPDADGSAGSAGDGSAGDGSEGDGSAGDSSVDSELEIEEPTLAAGKTYVPFTGKLSARGGTAHYTWTLTSGTLPAGLSLQGASSATVTIAGTASEAGHFPLSLSVTDGATTKTVDVTLVITHSALFLSDRNIAGVNELFITELGAESAAAPVRLSASIPAGGGVSSYAWSPDGSKVLYLATQSAGGAAELWVASLATPGVAQRVSAVGVTVGKMVWLGSGNIAAYSTSVGDIYLADLSGTGPSPSKLAIAGQGGAVYALQPSPNGRSLVVVGPATSGNFDDTILVTWAANAPTTVPLQLSVPVGSPARFSYEGRFAVIAAGSGAVWADLSLSAPTTHSTGAAHGTSLSWSPSADMLLIETGGATYEISRLDFTSGSLTTTVLASPSLSTCGSASVQPWSPDGKNGVFTCGRDLRGFSNVATAAVGTDFSLLPSGFLSNAFTDTPSVGWSPDSKWVATRADRDVDAQYDLQLIRWSAPGVAYRPHANTITPGVTNWAFAQNSQTVAFVGTIAPQNNAGLYLTKLPTTGAPPTATLISAPAASVVQTDINWLPGSRVIAYRAVVSGAAQLFTVPVAADGNAGSPISISGVSGTGVSSYQLAPSR